MATAPLARSRVGAAIWDRAWAQLERHGSGTAWVLLHGQRTAINVGHPYPAFMRRWPKYNSPLVHAVRLTYAARQRPLTLVDVGASVGDTALLVRERCPAMVDQIFCIEGDDDFAAMLAENVSALPGVHVIPAMVGDGSTTVPSLIRTHAGSASSRGPEQIGASTLDALVMATANVDVVKIDTDGFDGRVLLGSRGTLARCQPVVQFEWHPALTQAAGVAIDLSFTVLADAGYDTFVWFDKFGRFFRATRGVDVAEIAERAEWCIHGVTPAPDWHYDVIALAPTDGGLSERLQRPAGHRPARPTTLRHVRATIRRSNATPWRRR